MHFVILISLIGIFNMAAISNVNSGALFFNPATGGVNQALSPGNALVGTQGFGLQNQGGQLLGAATENPQATAQAAASADNVAYLADQASQLRSLLARTDTGLNQGLTQNEDEYNRNLGQANAQKEQQYSLFGDQRVAQNKGKLSAYDTINRNAGNGYRSLAQIIGRAAGTGSSAFRDMLPNVLGKDTSSKRAAASDTYGQNLAGIDKSQKQYDISFAGVLDDLMRQKKANESSLRTGIETQRQGIQSQLASNAGQTAQARGGGFAAVKAAQAPFQSAIDNSRNQVESFFNQYRTPYTPGKAVADAPNLADYTVDRSAVNGQQQGTDGGVDPYAALLRKRLQGAA